MSDLGRARPGSSETTGPFPPQGDIVYIAGFTGHTLSLPYLLCISPATLKNVEPIARRPEGIWHRLNLACGLQLADYWSRRKADV